MESTAISSTRATPAFTLQPMRRKILCGIVALFACAVMADEVAVANTPAVQEAQRLAILKYPSLAEQGSKLNDTFVRLFKIWKISQPQVLQRDDWPLLLADAAYQAMPREKKSPSYIVVPVDR